MANDTFLRLTNGLFLPREIQSSELSSPQTVSNAINRQKLFDNFENCRYGGVGINEDQENNMNIMKNNDNNIINNNTKKFFTDCGQGYKCSCSKTQCNRYYCECYSSGRYCLDCNCKNCLNQPPENCSSNRHQTPIPNKVKTVSVICTCTKSGCNKKYCECFKNGTKCTPACRCVGCENSESGKKTKDESYECCSANSIYIINNEILVEDIYNFKKLLSKENKTLTKKRKREENNSTINRNDSKEFKESDLFDKNGKIILKHFNLS